jgi:hypothetical protein
MIIRPENPSREQELAMLLDLCERSKPLPKGVKETVEARFYAMARKWVPPLVAGYKKATKEAL